METITKPSITRLARQAGNKSMSEDCYNTTRALIVDKLNEIVNSVVVVNSEHQTKTIMVDDVYNALSLLGYNVSRSTELSTTK